MNGAFVLLGVILGVFCVAAYVVIAAVRRRLRELQLAHALQVLLSGLGIVAGMKGCVRALDPSFPIGLTAGDRIIFFLGCIALVWVSIETIIRTFSGMFPKGE
jgi:hypothetical protein